MGGEASPADGGGGGGPYVLRPEWQRLGPAPARRMLESDLRLQPKFAHGQCPAGPHFQPPAAAPIPFLPQPVLDETDIAELQAYLESRDANLMVPPPAPPAEEAASEEAPGAAGPWKARATGASLASTGGGIGVTDERGVREHFRSGYTRRNPNGHRNPDGSWNTITRDDDFGGKFQDHAEIAGGRVEGAMFDAAAAQGRFGTPTDTFAGSGSVFSATAKAGTGFSITQEGREGVSPGLRADAGATAEAAALRGQVGTREALSSQTETLATGEASGSAVSGKAEARGELVLTAEQATLGGKLGAELNLLEGKAGGDLHITPRRVANNAVRLYNWAFDQDVAPPLDENWDIGFTIGGEVSGQVGAQAGAEARVGYENGTARGEVGAKIGLGLGAGVKARGGVVGLDRAAGLVRDGAGAAWRGVSSGAGAAWDGLSSGASDAWDWAWGD